MDEGRAAPNRGSLALLAVVAALGLGPAPAAAQIDLEAYNRFLAHNVGTTAADLQARFGDDVFLAAAGTDLAAAAFADSVAEHYGLTDYEQGLLQQHGFVVTERDGAAPSGAVPLEVSSHPNPFNGQALIRFRVGGAWRGSRRRCGSTTPPGSPCATCCTRPCRGAPTRSAGTAPTTATPRWPAAPTCSG